MVLTRTGIACMTRSRENPPAGVRFAGWKSTRTERTCAGGVRRKKVKTQKDELTPRRMQKRMRAVVTLDVTTPMFRGLLAFLERLGYEYETKIEEEQT